MFLLQLPGAHAMRLPAMQLAIDQVISPAKGAVASIAPTASAQIRLNMTGTRSSA
jgi:hypothetical protein